MDFELTEENIMFREAIRKFAQKEVAPLVDEAEETNVFPRQLFKKAAEQGFLCPRYPVELGGGGGDKIVLNYDSTYFEINSASELTLTNTPSFGY